MSVLSSIGFALRKALEPFIGPVSSLSSWWPVVRESFPGAWQQNIEVRTDSVLAFHAVFACITLIAADIGKLRARLVELDDDHVWSEIENGAFSPVLRKPNRYQNAIQFREWWIISKVARGNAYALKQRDARGVVVALYLLDSSRVQPLVADDGSVYYRLGSDNLSGLQETDTVVPASEIIHDRFNCLFHPLVGLSPIFACGLAGTQGLQIQANSSRFFGNMSRPSGILTAPGAIKDETAARLKAKWEENYGGTNVGKVAVLGDGLKYEAISVTAVEAQLIEQLKWTAEVVCSCFHMPAFKVGVGTMPTYQNGEILNQVYYTDCLQSLIESFELCMDGGLGLDEKIEGRWLGVELDLSGLLRMDQSTQVKTLREAVAGGFMKPDEARQRLDMGPVDGGDQCYLQQQNYSLAALAKRDAKDDPFASATSGGAAAPDAGSPAANDSADELAQAQEDAAAARLFYAELIKALEVLATTEG